MLDTGVRVITEEHLLIWLKHKNTFLAQLAWRMLGNDFTDEGFSLVTSGIGSQL